MIDLEAAAQHREAATSLRRRGDSLRSHAASKRAEGQDDAADALEDRATQFLGNALAKLDAALDELDVEPPGDEPPTAPPSPAGGDEAGWAPDASETLGSRGGVLSRLRKDADALASYKTGALVETAHNLTTTYCRGNVVRLSLQLGTPLAELTPEIEQLRDTLDAQMSSPSSEEAPDPWDYANLGDYHLMLNDITSAQSTYANFVRLADTGSPEKTWKALNNTAASMEQKGDPSAAQFARAVEAVRPKLKPDAPTP